MIFSSLRPAAIGIAAAFRTSLWVRGARLQRVLDASASAESPRPPAEAAGSATNDRELELALRAASVGLRVLGRARPVWRNTCLYRSIAQWLVLRAYGRRASVRIGVRAHPADSASAVTAHAWVDYDGPEPVEMPAAGYEALRKPGVGRATAGLQQ